LTSDISSIIQSELINTFDSLLSIRSSVKNVQKLSLKNIKQVEYVKITSLISLNNEKSQLIFFLPTSIATKFEYFMLGGIGDIKQSLDNNIVDASKEIISTIGGGLTTTIKAQDFNDIKDFSFELEDGSIIQYSDISDDTNLYKVNILFDSEHLSMLLKFDKILIPFLSTIVSGNKIENIDEVEYAKQLALTSKLDSVLSLLGEHSSDNLKLLFDVKLKFSVRLGRKTFLLKDIVNWDIGEIIELDQMVNEPLDILINNIKVGVGEAVIVENKFGIKIKYIGIQNV
jgi:flagellar motor switch protein FliN/FliY